MMNKIAEFIQQNGIALIIYFGTAMWFSSNIETRVAYAERELANLQTINTSLSTMAARVAVLESEIKANSRMVEQVYGYVRATENSTKK